ncbi:MAG: TlpA disulfide reductase family protein [Rhodospirillales bacterium]
MTRRLNAGPKGAIFFILALLASAGGFAGALAGETAGKTAGEAGAAAEAAACRPPEGLFRDTRTPEAGAPVPPSAETVVDGEGREVSIADFTGRGVVMNFWATWCAPCIREMPTLNAARPLLAPDGVEVIAVSEDRAEPATVAKIMAQNGWDNLPMLMDPNSRLLRDLKGPGLPFTVLIDAKGREVLRAAGEAEWDAPAMLAFLRACLKPAP